MIDPLELAGHIAQSATLLGNHLAGPVKAMLYCVDDPDLSVTLQFNPDDMRLDRGISPGHGNGLMYAGFNPVSGANDSLVFDTWLDVSEPSGAEAVVTSLLPYTANILGKSRSIQEDMEALYKLTVPGKHEDTDIDDEVWAPVVVFLWQDFKFSGVITSLTFSIKLFDVLGAPQRAQVSIKMDGRAFWAADSSADVNEDAAEPQSFSSGLLGAEATYAAKTATLQVALRLLNRLR